MRWLQWAFLIFISNLRQQSCRAGRRKKDSLSVLFGDRFPTDQYYMKNPNELFTKPNCELQVDLIKELIQFHPNEDSAYFGSKFSEIDAVVLVAWIYNCCPTWLDFCLMHNYFCQLWMVLWTTTMTITKKKKKKTEINAIVLVSCEWFGVWWTKRKQTTTTTITTRKKTLRLWPLFWWAVYGFINEETTTTTTTKRKRKRYGDYGDYSGELFMVLWTKK